MKRSLLLLLIGATLPAASIHTDFEGGSLGRVEQVTRAHYRLHVKGESDQDGRNRQANWYYFRVDDAAPGAELILDLVNLPGEYNYKPNRGAVTADTPPVISEDDETWRHVETFEYDPAEPRMRLRVKPTRSRFWIAHTPPYTGRHLERLRRDVRAHGSFREREIGKTAGGRPLLLWSAGDSGPVIWLMFRQHSWESGSSWAAEGLVRELMKSAELRSSARWKIYPLCDPDGVARGGVRFNANGYDLNRNWDVADPAKMPEIAAQWSTIREWVRGGQPVDLFLTVHNTETSEYLQGPPAGGLGARLFRLLETQSQFAPSRPYSSYDTSGIAKGRFSAVEWLYRELSIPAFLMELRVAMHPKFGRRALAADRIQFGVDLARILRDAVLSR